MIYTPYEVKHLTKNPLFLKIHQQLFNEESECTMSPECPCDDCQSENVWMDR